MERIWKYKHALAQRGKNKFYYCPILFFFLNKYCSSQISYSNLIYTIKCRNILSTGSFYNLLYFHQCHALLKVGRTRWRGFPGLQWHQGIPVCLQELLGEPGHGAEARPDGGHDKGRHDGDRLHDRNAADAGPSVSALVLICSCRHLLYMTVNGTMSQHCKLWYF